MMSSSRAGLVGLLLVSCGLIATAAYLLAPPAPPVLQAQPLPAALPSPPLSPRFADAIVAQARDSSLSQAVFPIDTARVYAAADLIDVPVGSRIGVHWVALGRDATSQEAVFSSDEMVVDSPLDRASFILGRPQGGWRPGAYRVDLLLNEQVQAKLPFRVE